MGEKCVYAYDFVGNRYDVGNRLGFVKATVEFALKRDDLKSEVTEYLKGLVGTL
jgi:UTP--glucose-1-phosphate uridylyltransferase